MLVLFFSCEKPGAGIIYCSECESTEPTHATLNIKLEKSYTYNTTVNIFEGNLEDNVLYKSISTVASNISQSVPLNRKYTVTATYNDMGNCYITVNSVTPRVLYDENYCDEPCYFIYDKDVDLTLKYKKYGK
jgi:hypothetical protein